MLKKEEKLSLSDDKLSFSLKNNVYVRKTKFLFCEMLKKGEKHSFSEQLSFSEKKTRFFFAECAKKRKTEFISRKKN